MINTKKNPIEMTKMKFNWVSTPWTNKKRNFKLHVTSEFAGFYKVISVFQWKLYVKFFLRSSFLWFVLGFPSLSLSFISALSPHNVLALENAICFLTCTDHLALCAYCQCEAKSGISKFLVNSTIYYSWIIVLIDYLNLKIVCKELPW